MNDSPESLGLKWQVPEYRVELWKGATSPWCVVIPVINEGSRILSLLRRMGSLGISAFADVLIVDGGSTDGSLELWNMEAMGVRGLLVKTGRGKLSAQLRCAYAFALRKGYEGIVTIDGNDKDDPEAIAAFVQELAKGTDFVQASRFVLGGIAENTPWIRTFAIRWVHAPLIKLASGFAWTDTTQGFRAYSRRMLLDPRIDPFREIFESYELLAYLSCRCPRLGFKCIELPTARRYPFEGKVPTKISAVNGNFQVFRVLIKACLGCYSPK